MRLIATPVCDEISSGRGFAGDGVVRCSRMNLEARPRLAEDLHFGCIAFNIQQAFVDIVAKRIRNSWRECLGARSVSMILVVYSGY